MRRSGRPPENDGRLDSVRKAEERVGQLVLMPRAHRAVALCPLRQWGSTAMSTSVIESLRSSLDGPLVAEGDSGYDEARVVYNAMIDRRPTAIVRCQGTDDVVAVVRAAAESRTDLAIRGGGHSVPGFGTADGALVVDLGDLTSVDVDPASSTAEVGGGTTWGTFNAAAGVHGLATTGGIISTT